MSIRILPDKDAYYPRLPQFSTIANKDALHAIVAEYREAGYDSETCFKTEDWIVIPDPENWVSGRGRRIYRHIWFFKRPMTRSWAQDIACGDQSHDGRYIGVHKNYSRHRPEPTRVVSGKFSPNALVAWLQLFSPKPEMESTAQVVPYMEYILRNNHAAR